MRKLICIYDIHLDQDLESETLSISAEDVRRLKRKAHGEDGVKDLEKIIHKFYDTLEERFSNENVDALYQDGGVIDWATVAETKPEAYGEYLRDMEKKAAAGSRSFGLVLDLAGRGAKIRQTEDPGLLMKAVTYSQGYIQLARVREELRQGRTYSREEEEEILALAAEVSRQQERLPQLGQERDRAIAANINSSLQEGQTGLLIIGATHTFKAYLDEDIVVEELMPEGVERYLG